jgi:hypothetical protein
MSTKRRNFSCPLILTLTIILAGLYFVSARTTTNSPTVREEANARSAELPQNNLDSNLDRNLYVQHYLLPSRLRDAIKVIGDRMEKPGKERLVLTGTLSRAGDSQPSPVSLILEFPNRLRLEEQSSGSRRVITFNNQDATDASGRALDRKDEDLVETLVYDSVEHFFAGQMQGAATRFLGPRFRLDDGTAVGYEGPSYDIYEVTEEIKVGQETRPQTKLYYFNSDTQLLEIVRYQLMRDGFETAIEVRLSDWREVQGQKLPSRIVRIENNAQVWSLSFTTTNIAPRADDGIFGGQ